MNADDSNAEAVKVPAAAAWLGGLGLIPFAGLAAATVLLEGAPKLAAAHALSAYGAAILSFLGGVHWGLAIAGEAVRTNLAPRLVLSVTPSLIAWSALLVPPAGGLLVLAASVAALLWIDLRMTRLAQAPAWYPKLRIPLTCGVVAALLAGALF